VDKLKKSKAYLLLLNVLMVLLLVVKPVEGWCSVASSVLPQVIEMVVRGMVNKPKEEKAKRKKRRKKP
jgi:glucose uptake protein GlcU